MVWSIVCVVFVSCLDKCVGGRGWSEYRGVLRMVCMERVKEVVRGRLEPDVSAELLVGNWGTRRTWRLRTAA